MSAHSGKVVVITGSSRGIGLLLAQKFSLDGADVVIMGRNLPAAEEAVRTLATAASFAVRCDVSVEEDTLRMAEVVRERFGRVDALINNAGVFPVKLFEDMTLDDWNGVIDIDLKGTFLATKAIYPMMLKQKSGKIVNVTSVAGRIGGYGFTHYSAAKGGVIAFTKALARECASMNIQVNAVAPGIVETETALQSFPAFSLKEQKKQTPAGRLAAPGDLYGAISFLCSGESDFIVGQTISVDGGYTMI
ncbi:MAG: 3-oxoacyl-ACP reductase FabG [Synergistaceae bacterium]|jgi:3-oxoacyl-[acyl-carrier protein] reductase|nr:3-oxoacyl-ACP reductase FabG [Synergistaceae bacterium]